MPKLTDAMLRLMEAWPDRWHERMMDEMGRLFEAEEVLHDQRADGAEDGAAHGADDSRREAYTAILFSLIVRAHQFRLMFRLVALALFGLLLLGLAK